MRTPAAFISGMATMGVLAGGIAWGTGAANETTSTDASAATNGNSESTSSESTATATPSPVETTAPAASNATDGTYQGDTVQTRYGPMQVEVVIQNGAITSATALQQPDGDRESVQINAQVIPILNSAIVEYQSLDFGNVSRATISTDGYKQSAQSALDKAGFTG